MVAVSIGTGALSNFVWLFAVTVSFPFLTVSVPGVAALLPLKLGALLAGLYVAPRVYVPAPTPLRLNVALAVPPETAPDITVPITFEFLVMLKVTVPSPTLAVDGALALTWAVSAMLEAP
jgi:hypothetical protein